MGGFKKEKTTQRNRKLEQNLGRAGRPPSWLIPLISGGLAFSFGVAVGVYKFPPYEFLFETKNYLQSLVGLSSTDNLVDDLDELSFAFSQNLVIDGPLFYPHATNPEDVRALNLKHFVEVTGFEEAFSTLDVMFSEQYTPATSNLPVVRLHYSYRGETREAFLYGVMPMNCEGTNLGSLIIPGTGDNQSSGIWSEEKSNYHFGIREALPRSSENHQYVLIKPNHDFLAWHDGKGRKLAGDYYFAWHLNRGGSYSASYLLDALAATKWMKSCYSKTAVVGLSQGGNAALMVSLQAQPDYALVSSAISFAFRNVLPSGPHQIIGVPGFSDINREEIVGPKLLATKTRYLFTWGKQEPGAYGKEAREGDTFRYLDQLPNVRALGHEGGHVFPVVEIQQFFREFGY